MKTLINPRIYGVFYALLKRVPLLVFAGIIIHACSDMDEIGLDLIDTRAQMHSLDTLTIKAMTIPGDSIAMNLGSNNILGIINDPVFGKTRASIYTETRLSTNNLSLGESKTTSPFQSQTSTELFIQLFLQDMGTLLKSKLKQKRCTKRQNTVLPRIFFIKKESRKIN